jgi:hypothetical protein
MNNTHQRQMPSRGIAADGYTLWIKAKLLCLTGKPAAGSIDVINLRRPVRSRRKTVLDSHTGKTGLRQQDTVGTQLSAVAAEPAPAMYQYHSALIGNSRRR